MVTFRFYVVSTVAFFLALAVGVVVGSVLDGRIADSMRDRLDGVEQSLDETVAAIDAKNAEIELQGRYIEESAPYVVESTMDGTATMVVAETGIDGAALEDLVRRLRQGGSRVEGVIWLDRRMELSDEADRAALADLIGAPPTADAAELRAAMWQSVFSSLSADTAPAGSGGGDGEVDGAPTTAPGATSSSSSSASSSTTTVLEAPEAAGAPVPPIFEQSPLSELAEAGLLRLQSIDGGSNGPADELVVVGVTGPRATISHPGAFVGGLAAAAAERGVPVLLGEVHPQSEEEGSSPVARGELLVLPDGSDPLETAGISTVDDLELLGGRVAGVLALSDLREGRSGRYGLGPEVDGLIPPWQGP